MSITENVLRCLWFPLVSFVFCCPVALLVMLLLPYCLETCLEYMFIKRQSIIVSCESFFAPSIYAIAMLSPLLYISYKPSFLLLSLHCLLDFIDERFHLCIRSSCRLSHDDLLMSLTVSPPTFELWSRRARELGFFFRLSRISISESDSSASLSL